MLTIEEKARRYEELVKYRNDYAKDHYKRISVFMMPDDAERVKQAAKKMGMSINGFIGEAVLHYMEQERG